MVNRLSILVGAAALGVVGLVSNPAGAADVSVRVSGGSTSVSFGGSRSCSWHGHEVAGTLTIDGCVTTIRSGCDVREDIVRAFRRAGYHAFCDDGQVIVRYDCRRPRVQWCSDGWGASFRWENGCVRVNAYERSCDACASRTTIVWRDFGRDRWSGRDPGRCRPARPPHRGRRCR